MPTRPGIIIPAVLFASWADKGLALVVMGGLCRKKSARVKTAVGARVGRNVKKVTTSTLAAGFLLTDEKDASRYTLTRDGQLVSVLDYRDDGRTIALTRAFTIPTFRGHGYAGVVVEGAVADIEERGDRTVDAVCWYVADWFQTHPEHASLLRSR
jgi:predicted GNAT family acetyltransferase